MPRLVRRRLRCFYCNNYASNDLPGIPREWFCAHCEAVNHLDERGQITDPPILATAPPASIQYVHSRSPSPAMIESPFCSDCQRNQLLVNKTLAEYIPDSEDPEYEQRLVSVDAYRDDLERRYPPVCDNCIKGVREQIRAAGYAAKADHLRRILENTKKTKVRYYTTRQLWTLRIITLARGIYYLSIIIGLLWHAVGLLVVPKGRLVTCNLIACLSEALKFTEIDMPCYNSGVILNWVQASLFMDFLSIWWNPQLRHLADRPGGSMRGLIPLWLLRTLVLALRTATLQSWQTVPQERDLRYTFRMVHGVMIVIIFISVLISWKAVRIEYQSTSSFMRPVTPYLPSPPTRARREDADKWKETALPKYDTFDTMAQSFTASFPTANLTQGDQQADFPPSPTLTEASTFTYETESPYFFQRKRSTGRETDAMDWTPTQRRFATNGPEIQPSMFSEPPIEAAQPQKHSIFAQRDPNPFAHRVPAFPKNSTREKLDPWKPGVWAPALPENKKNFFADMMKKGESPESRQRLKESGVPKTVKRNAELFQSPRLKYDHYGYAGEKTTGLENKFNDLFSE